MMSPSLYQIFASGKSKPSLFLFLFTTQNLLHYSPFPLTSQTPPLLSPSTLAYLVYLFPVTDSLASLEVSFQTSNFTTQITALLSRQYNLLEFYLLIFNLSVV